MVSQLDSHGWTTSFEEKHLEAFLAKSLKFTLLKAKLGKVMRLQRAMNIRRLKIKLKTEIECSGFEKPPPTSDEMLLHLAKCVCDWVRICVCV